MKTLGTSEENMGIKQAPRKGVKMQVSVEKWPLEGCPQTANIVNSTTLVKGNPCHGLKEDHDSIPSTKNKATCTYSHDPNSKIQWLKIFYSVIQFHCLLYSLLLSKNHESLELKTKFQNHDKLWARERAQQLRVFAFL